LFTVGGFFVTAKLEESLGEKQPGKFPFLGDVIILIEGATFSTASDFCAVTHHLKRAIFIGEETAGAYYGNNSGTEPTVTLPNSKVRFGLPLCGSWNAVSGDDGKPRETIPDHVAVYQTADVLRELNQPLTRTLVSRPMPETFSTKNDRRRGCRPSACLYHARDEIAPESLLR
jgi:hypothetical protein